MAIVSMKLSLRHGKNTVAGGKVYRRAPRANCARTGADARPAIILIAAFLSLNSSKLTVKLRPGRLAELTVILLFISLLAPVQANNFSQNPLEEPIAVSRVSLDISVTDSHSNPYSIRKRSSDPMWVHRLIFASLNGLLFLLGLANVLVLFIVSRYRRMRTVTNILIFNLCLADLIYISFLPVVIMFQVLRDWMFGIVACKLFYITESTAKYASVYFVGVLSLDRYFALCHSQVCKRYRRPSLAILVSVIGWCVTATLMTPIYLYSTVIGEEGGRFCTVAWPNDDRSGLSNDTDIDIDHQSINDTCANCNDTQMYAPPFMQAPSTQFYFITLTFVFCFGLPALVILFFYFKVLDQLFQASNRAERLKKRREKTYRKVTRMVLTVISFYLICWLPYWIQFLVVTFATFSLNNALKIFFNTIHLLPYLNCAMNPILYSLMTDNFRRILGELFPLSHFFSRLFGQRRRQPSGSSQKGQAVALLDRKSRLCVKEATVKGDGYDEDLQANGGSMRTSLSASISPSIRMISDLSINMLSVRKSGDHNGSTSATSLSTV